MSAYLKPKKNGIQWQGYGSFHSLICFIIQVGTLKK